MSLHTASLQPKTSEAGDGELWKKPILAQLSEEDGSKGHFNPKEFQHLLDTLHRIPFRGGQKVIPEWRCLASQ